MPRITLLQRTPRRPGWYDLHLDGALFCRLPCRRPKALGLEVGAELAETDAAALRDRLHRERALAVALRYLAHRPRSRFEVERHLRDRGYLEEAVAAAIDRCEAMEYLDDRDFARSYALDRIRLRPRSIARIEAELRHKGVAAAAVRAGVAEALAEEQVSEPELARRAVARGLARLAPTDPEDARRRLGSYMSRRGFRRDAALEAIEAAVRARWGS